MTSRVCTLYSRFVLEPQEVKFLRVVCKRKEDFKIDSTTLANLKSFSPQELVTSILDKANVSPLGLILSLALTRTLTLNP